MGPRGPAFGQPSALSTRSISSLSYISEPPSLTSISDPNVVVSFKNLLKKDPTTKARALEDLIAHAQTRPYEADHGGVEEPILEVWVSNERDLTQMSRILPVACFKY